MFEAMQKLQKYGLNVVGKIVTLEEALKMPRPIVLKADTEEHKSEKKLVFVNLKEDEEIKEAYSKIAERYRVIAQPLIKGFEFIIGSMIDPTFGKVIMVGAGGIYAEIFRDIAFRAVPVTESDVNEMLKELKISKVFEGFRGRKANKEELVKAVLGVSKFAEENEFKELDINPIIVNEEGAFVVDVRLIT